MSIIQVTHERTEPTERGGGSCLKIQRSFSGYQDFEPEPKRTVETLMVSSKDIGCSNYILDINIDTF